MTYDEHRNFSPQFRQGADAGEKVGAARAIEELKETLQEQFDAYPVSVFPEPDLERVSKILAEHGIALDCVSASAIRAALKVTARIVNSVVST